ncbi:uncharacterized protein LOC143459521 isoform X1 [Clavelina lepadiformis]|uniref:uncharacterized protein LOC143459521 isoform X1 n=1 Tax=Clavelina lepadiformis TaxID=159417 RepID=UPI0040429B85
MSENKCSPGKENVSPLAAANSGVPERHSPISRILLNRQKEDVYESNGSPLPSPATQVFEYSVVHQKNLQRMETLSRENAALSTELTSEQELRFKLQRLNEEQILEISRLKQDLDKTKKEQKKAQNEFDLTLEDKQVHWEKKLSELQEINNKMKRSFEDIQINLEIEKKTVQDFEKTFERFEKERELSKTKLKKLELDVSELQQNCSNQEKVLLLNEEKLISFARKERQWLDEQDILQNALNDAESRCRKPMIDLQPSVQGESMSVATEFEVRALNEKIAHLKKVWLSPGSAEDLRRELKDEKDAHSQLMRSHSDLKKAAQVMNEEKSLWQQKLRKSKLEAESSENHLYEKIAHLKKVWLSPGSAEDLRRELKDEKDAHSQLMRSHSDLKKAAQVMNEEKSLWQQKLRKSKLEAESSENHLYEKIAHLKKVWLSPGSAEDLRRELKDEKDAHSQLMKSHSDLKKAAQVMNEEKFLWQQKLRKSKLEAESSEDEIKRLDQELKSHQAKYRELSLRSHQLFFSPGTPILRRKSQESFKSPHQKYDSLLNDSLDLAIAKRSPIKKNQFHTLLDDGCPLRGDINDNIGLSRNYLSMETSLLNENNIARNAGNVVSDSIIFDDSAIVDSGSYDLRIQPTARPSLLGLPLLEEPDYPNTSCSLHRIAELQGRNAKQLPHLKSSYPIETQGKTPRRCDEAIRVGNADTILQRINQLNTSAQSTSAGLSQDLPGYRPSGRQALTRGRTKRKIEASENFSQVKLNPLKITKPSLVFEIPVTPPPAKKIKEENKLPESNIPSRSGQKMTIKKRTPSLMDRVRKPLGKLRLRK